MLTKHINLVYIYKREKHNYNVGSPIYPAFICIYDLLIEHGMMGSKPQMKYVIIIVCDLT